ncbi:MAG: GNAT family N-acetyltransferase [Proteobacteria bacterium]|nr:GNAT family N-acetyltransferase [Pseudomonadota bacterium]
MARTLRFARPADAARIHQLIVDLATYEREADQVEVTPEVLAAQIAQTPPLFECVMCDVDGESVGFALFFHNYSTWTGKRGLWLEDLYVEPSRRGEGHGRALLAELARIAVERDCARMEWPVLDWNEPTIGFYRSLGTVPMDEWTRWRLTGDSLKALATEG